MQEISFRNDVLPLKNKLFRLALRITLNREEAEDVVQDTMIKVWNARERWQDLEIWTFEGKETQKENYSNSRKRIRSK
jgi:DNA-directed RNA polymerase specialized sigma24 family protein